MKVFYKIIYTILLLTLLTSCQKEKISEVEDTNTNINTMSGEASDLSESSLTGGGNESGEYENDSNF